MKKRVAIVQPFYIPWKGYFDLINSVAEFVLLDDVQYARRSWINRNKIKTPQGLIWMTIPVKVKGKFRQAIKDIEIDDPGWKLRHWEILRRNYARAPYFGLYAERFEELYLGCREDRISRIDHRFISAICDLLGIKTKLSRSTDFRPVGGKTARLVDLCRQLGADSYLSGPRARSYIQSGLFEEAGIELQYMDYAGYPEYRQLYPPFCHEVSILDLLFHTGPRAREYMKSFRPVAAP